MSRPPRRGAAKPFELFDHRLLASAPDREDGGADARAGPVAVGDGDRLERREPLSRRCQQRSDLRVEPGGGHLAGKEELDERVVDEELVVEPGALVEIAAQPLPEAASPAAVAA